MRQNPENAVARFHRSFPVAAELADGLATLREAWETAAGCAFSWDGGSFAQTLAEPTPFGRRYVDVSGSLEHRGDGVDISVRIEPHRTSRFVVLTLAVGVAGGVALGVPLWLLAGGSVGWIAALLALILAIAGDVNAQRMATRAAERRLKTACGHFAAALAPGDTAEGAAEVAEP